MSELTGYLNSINKKTHYIESGNFKVKSYPMYIINKILTCDRSNVLLVNAFNNPNIPAHAHYTALIVAIPHNNGYNSLPKVVKHTKLDSIKEYYGCNTNVALEYQKLLTDSQILHIENILCKGGKK